MQVVIPVMFSEKGFVCVLVVICLSFINGCALAVVA